MMENIYAHIWRNAAWLAVYLAVLIAAACLMKKKRQFITAGRFQRILVLIIIVLQCLYRAYMVGMFAWMLKPDADVYSLVTIMSLIVPLFKLGTAFAIIAYFVSWLVLHKSQRKG